MGMWFKIILLIFPLFNIDTAKTGEGAEILNYCLGEGCGCTNETKTNRKFTLYAEMDTESKVLGDFPSGVDAKSDGSFTKIISPGKSVVLKVNNSDAELKVGDEVSTVLRKGEGVTEVRLGKKSIEFNAGEIELKTIEKTKKEGWYRITVDGKSGYSKKFPFHGCLAGQP